MRDLLAMIRFSHTVFAFPFALLGVVLASVHNGRVPHLHELGWICLAMVGARTGAMACNRIFDRHIDAANPRTAQRHLPAGQVKLWEAWGLALAGFALLLVSAWQLNPLCFYLAPVAILFLLGYSLAKRFTALAHLVLGLCLAAAPLGAYIALTGALHWPVLAVALAVLLWVAGFDIFYALQDIDFDRAYGLYSVPARWGEKRAIHTVRWLHVGMVLLLLAAWPGSGLGALYGLGVLVVAGLLVYEHTLVKPGDLSRLDAAFFTMNGYISVTLFLFAWLDAMWL